MSPSQELVGEVLGDRVSLDQARQKTLAEQSSADQRQGGSEVVQGANHSTMAKPRDGYAVVYAGVRHLVMDTISEAARGTTEPVFNETGRGIVNHLRADGSFSDLPA